MKNDLAKISLEALKASSKIHSSEKILFYQKVLENFACVQNEKPTRVERKITFEKKMRQVARRTQNTRKKLI